MKKYTAFFLVVSFLFAPLAVQAFDFCKCTKAWTPAEAWQISAAVFTGKVTSIKDYRTENQRIYFKVYQSWKGPQTEEIKLFTERADLLGLVRYGVTCGYEFREGEEYLVYAYTEKHSPLKTDKCIRTRKLSEAEEDINALGTPEFTVTEQGIVRRTLEGTPR